MPLAALGLSAPHVTIPARTSAWQAMTRELGGGGGGGATGAGWSMHAATAQSAASSLTLRGPGRAIVVQDRPQGSHGHGIAVARHGHPEQIARRAARLRRP